MLGSLPLSVHLVAGLIAGLTLFTAVALRVELELPWWVTLVLTTPAVVGGMALAKAVAMLTPVAFPESVLGLSIVLFFLAGGYEMVSDTPG